MLRTNSDQFAKRYISGISLMQRKCVYFQERIWLFNIIAYLFTHLLICLLTYLLTYFLPSLLTYLLTYLLTSPWSRVLEKLTGFQLVKKFPAFYETRRFITAFTSACHLSLFWARSTQNMPSIPLPEDPSKYFPPTYAWIFQVVSFLQVSPPKPCIHLSPTRYLLLASPISFFSILSPE